jgi:hypothetical protein
LIRTSIRDRRPELPKTASGVRNVRERGKMAGRCLGASSELFFETHAIRGEQHSNDDDGDDGDDDHADRGRALIVRRIA